MIGNKMTEVRTTPEKPGGINNAMDSLEKEISNLISAITAAGIQFGPVIANDVERDVSNTASNTAIYDSSNSVLGEWINHKAQLIHDASIHLNWYVSHCELKP